MGIPFMDPIQQLITEDVYGCLKKRWLILYHFKKNFIDLEEKKKELEKLRGKVEEQVEKAREQSEVIIKEVSEWMVDMEKTKKEVDVLLQEKTRRESIVCFRFGFPNYISRYRLSKRAEEKTVDVQKKIDGGNFSAVSGPAPPPPELQLPPTIGEYKIFESRAAVLNKIKDALKENNVVGIHGAGGVGKTTMAAEVTKQLQSEGYIHEFAIAVVSQDPDVKRIQGKLASCLKDFKLDETENKEERAKKLWNRLKNGKSNLVILDDLWGKINLREIGIPVSGENKDCKLLITSRQPQEVWKDTTWDSKLHVKLIRIEQLKDKEAWELFKNHAGDSIESSDVHSIAMEVCKKCGGLPVAIRAVGEALNGKDRCGWNDALDKLKNYEMERIFDIDVKLFPSLKLSYEMLSNKEAQRCFLLCCLFPEDSEIPVEDIVLHCQAAEFVGTVKVEETRNRVNALIGILKSRCLLLDVPDNSYNVMVHGYCVKVHDVIRDVGVSISKEGNESLQLMHGFQNIRGGGEGASSNRRSPYIAMWLRKSHFEDDRVCPDAGTLVLQWNGSSVEDDHTLVRRANNFLSREDLSLKVFVLYGLSISSLFPSSCESLANLRMLCLDTWKEDDKNILLHLGKLEVLRISAAEFVELPTEVGLLTGLLVLDLRDARGMKNIPYGVFSKLTRLEELYLPLSPKNFIKWENGEDKRGGSELNCLKRLTTLWTCSRDSDFFNGLFLDKLKRFHIRVGTTLPSFSGHFTKVLEVSGVSLTPELRGLMGRAEKISIVDSIGSSAVINHGGIPCNMKELEIGRSRHLKCVVGEAEGLRAPLKQVGLEYIFSEPCARSLRQLRHLEVNNCRSLVSIIREVEEEILEQHQEDLICFDRLETLVLEDLPCFVGFYSRPDGERSVLFSDKIGCPSLSNLTIKRLTMINEIWGKQSVKRVLKSLVYVLIRGCRDLETIISEKLKENQQTADGDIALVFPLLRKAFLYGNNNLKSFYFSKFSMEGEPFFNSQVSCPALEELGISDGAPKIVWDEQSYKNFPNLKLLNLWNCSKIEVIVSNQGGANGDVLTFPQMRKLQLQRLGSVKSFYTVRSLPEEESFFNHQVECPVLEVLTIDGLSKIKKIWDEQSYKNFPNLKDLSIKDCHEIESIVSNQGKGNRVEANSDVLTFPQLRKLQLQRLGSVKSFYTVRSLPEEESFFNHPVECPVLEVLTIDGLSKIKKIWDEQSYKNFPNLKDLSIEDCHEIESIVSNQGKGNRVEANGDVLTFPQLRKLQLQRLGSVKSFYTVRSLPEEESFFNHQVECPVLEVLIIDGLSKIKKIWDEQSYKNFPNLKDLSIKDCHEIESIVSNPGKGNRVEANGDVLTFPQLRKLQLQRLGSVKSFYTVRSLPEEESFFNHQVECPVLEVLTIDGLSKIKKIWDEQSYKNFPNLKDLSIKDCHEIESIVSNPGKGNRVEADGDVLTFPQLRKLQLQRLGSVKGFYTVRSLPEEESFFNHQVECPVLEVLTIDGLSRIKKIWDEQSYKNFPHLKDLSIKDCHEIESIVSNQGKGNRVEANGDILTFPQLRKLQLQRLGSVKSFYTMRSLPEEESFFNHQVECPVLEVLTIYGFSKIKKIWGEQSYKNFPNLKDLSIKDCHEIESLVSNQGKGNRVEANGDILTFPQLKKLQLQRLGSVKSFYTMRSLPEEESFFNHQVECPVLEVLTIYGFSKIKKIWDEQSYRNFPNLKDLSIKDCHEIESIVSNQGKGNRVEANGDVLTFPQLKKLQLQTLESVKSFYTVRSLPEEESLFNHQVECPVLEVLTIYGLSKIKKIWDEQSYKNFPNLKDLSIKDCHEIESIVSNQGKGNRVEANGDVLTFPQLRKLQLQTLESVKSFYTVRSLPEEESFFNHQVECPVLEVLRIDGLSKIKKIWDEQSYKNFPNLKDLSIKDCHEIESIVSNQGKGNRVEANGDVLTFPQLRKLQLQTLGSVKSFYTVRSLPEEESFFKHQVECPVLEVLTIYGFSKIKKIWDEQSYKNFSNLKDLSIKDCHEIESIVSNQGKGNRVEANGDILTFPQLRKLQLQRLGSVKSFYTMRSLPEEESFFNHQIWDEQSYKNFPNLKHLSIKDCHEIESIVSNQGKGNRVVANGDVLTFPQLRKLQLQTLGSVKSFYIVRSLPEEESFFNHQVECPVLEVLTIYGFSKIKKIWDEQSYRNFPNLKDLSIKDCHEIESIVSNQGKGNRVEANGDVLTFPQLRKLQLQRLGSVKSFYTMRSLPEEESFFNHQVECPVLEVLTIYGFSKIKKIWDEQSYKNFPNLKDLSIKDCHEIESIVSNQGKGNRVEANGDVLTFPQLRKLQLQRLGSVKSFYTVRSLPEEESFFNHQVECPVLEVLTIDGLSKIKKIWDEQSYKNFPNLKDLSIKDCHEIESIVSNKGKGHRGEANGDVLTFPQLRKLQLQTLESVKSFYTVRSLPEEESFFNHQVECPVLEVLIIDGLSKIKKIWDEQSYKNFPNLKDLSIKDCHEIESIVSNPGKGNRVEANGDVLTFPQLRKLQLQRLGSVKSFYTVRSLPEEESFFNHQVECPVLEVLTIDGLSKIKKIWDEQSYKNFPNLKDLSIKYCHEIESIVSNQGKGNRVEATGDVVIFPQLRVLRLEQLRNIKSFYTLRSLPNQESFFKHQIIYPALERCEFLYIPKAKEVYEVKILPRLGSSQLKEICGQENKSQGVLLPKLRELGFEKEVIRYTPTGQRLNTVTDWIDFENCDKRLFHPLFDAFFGLGRE